MENSTRDSFKPNQRWKVWLLRIYSLLLSWFLVPLLATLIGAMLVSRIAGRLMAPTSYKIYVVGNMDRSVAAQKIAEAFNPENCHLPTFGGVPVEVLRRNDQGDRSQAQLLAQKLSRRPDTLLVVGHIGSGQTKEALPIYMEAQPAVPVILTTETTPDLVPASVKKYTHHPVLRLSPTDKEQARIAAGFVARQAAAKRKTVWVVQDVSDDTVYSEFLANDFVREAEKRHARVVLWSTNLNIPTAKTLHALNIGCVFFAGDWPAALVLIRELREIYGSAVPEIVLSDASVDPHLLKRGGKDVEGVYLTYPMKATEFREGYAVYGENACRVVQRLLGSEDTPPEVDQMAAKAGWFGYTLRTVFGIRRVKDARLVLRSRILYAEAYQITFTLPSGDEIRFGLRDKDGEEGARVDSGATFYLWRVTNDNFADIASANDEL
jgi:ABC-type branched-subunit amino acid transport system substrate-binding protein